MATAFSVATVEELPPGTRKVVTIRGIEIGVFNIAGAFYALPNLCTHQWGPLCTGRLTGTLTRDPGKNWQLEWVNEGQVVVCPWHSLEFDVTTGQCLAYPRVRLRQYPVRVERGIVKVLI